MYCSECGKPASGKFCSNCGTPLQNAPEPFAAPIPASAPVSNDWRNEINYEALLKAPEVRDILARQVPSAKGLSAEQYAEAFQKLVPLASAVPMAPMLGVARDFWSSFGIKTGKERAEHFSQPCGSLIVNILCSFTRHGYTMRSAQQGSNFCVLIAAIPSDLFTMEGDLIVTVKQEASGTSVSAATRIQGQLNDWGKSKRCLNHLFAELTSANC